MALFVVGLFVMSVGIVLTQHAAPTEEWAAISLNFGSNPVSNVLNISFARIGYLSQPAQWNTTGFVNASFTKGAGALWNSTDYGTNYGVMSVNSTATGVTDAASWPVSGELGANVSYIFTDQRAALNGTGNTWQYVIAESKITAAQPTTGSVLGSAAGAAQNEITVQAVYASGTYAFTAYDWENIYNTHGDWQNVTSYAIGAAADQAPLSFFEVYVYVQSSQTVVSIVNTTTGAVFASTAAMHPVLDKNMTSVAYLGDTMQAAASSTSSSAIVDTAYLVDHNTYTGSTCGSAPTTALAPLVTGALSPGAAAPFDPASASAAQQVGASGVSSFSNTNVKLNDFPSVQNSSTQGMMTSSEINASYLVPVDGIGSGVKNLTLSTPATIDPAQALTTMRAAGESADSGASVDLYVTSWSGAQISGGISSFLTNYVSAKTGISASCVHISSYFVNNIGVDTTFSAQAASTIHDYIASAIPGELSSNNLALVNTQTGAIEAGADIGAFMDLATGAIYSPIVHTSAYGFQTVYDPVNHVTYASAEAAGFPVGSSLTTAGAVFVPMQATFLGFSSTGLPEFRAQGCFLICTGGLTGAASAVSDFLGSASSTVANSLSTAGNTLTSATTAATAVLKPVTSGVTTDLGGLIGDVSGTVSAVMPAAGGTLANVASDVSGTITHTVSGVSSGIASATSSMAGALAAGLSQVQTTLYHVGALAGSAVANAATSVQKGLSELGTTVGSTLSAAGAVASNAFLSTANTIGQAGKEALSAASSSLSAAGSALSGVASDLIGAIEAPLKWLASLFSMPIALSSGISLLLEIAVIAVVVGLVIFLLVWFLVMRPRRRKSRQVGGGHERGRRASRRARHHARSHAAGWYDDSTLLDGLRLQAVPALA